MPSALQPPKLPKSVLQFKNPGFIARGFLFAHFLFKHLCFDAPKGWPHHAVVGIMDDL